MSNNGQDDILRLVEEAELQAQKQRHRTLILQPGAVGDCVLTLPLVDFLIEKCNVSGVDIIGHMDYISYFVNRSNINGMRSIDTVELHQLFCNATDFFIADDNRLFEVFTGYDNIISFMSKADDDFERNLISLVHCTHTAEITSIPFRAEQGSSEHIAEFYINHYARENQINSGDIVNRLERVYIRPALNDEQLADKLMKNKNIGAERKVAILAPGSGGLKKCLPGKNYIQIAKKLKNNGMCPVIILGPTELEKFNSDIISEFHNIAAVFDRLSLEEVFALIRCCEVFVGNDSGLSHIAGAAGKNTIAVFGPTNPVNYHPLGPNVNVVKLDGTEFHSDSTVVSDKIADVCLSLLNN